MINSAAVFLCKVCFLKSILLFNLTLIMPLHAMAQEPIKVNVVYPQQSQQNQTLTLPGTVEAKQHAQLATLEAGRVVNIQVEVGDEVAAGEELLALDSRLAQLEVQGALAEVKAASLNRQEAERLYQEAQSLSAQKVIAKTLIAERAALLANAEAQLAQVEARLSLQQERLQRHSLKAPFAGVVAHRNVDVGEWITPQNAVLTLVAQNDLRLAVQIPQQYFNRLKNNTSIPVKVIPDTPGINHYEATLSRLVPVSDVSTRTFAAQIDLPHDAVVGTGKLVTGMSALAEISLPDSYQTSITLPRAAIKQHPDGNSSVFIVVDDRGQTLAKRIVTDYQVLPNNLVAIKNQPADRAYIVSGVELLQDGTAVQVNLNTGTTND